ncbi:MAG: lamin tail domain-containing protein [Patescibacteria group bacterium]|nr:lamin tail domain-containing protein [Patescibacteria group bacterium]
MRRIQRLLQFATTSLACVGLLGADFVATARADTADAPSLVISQLKITSSNGQFVTLHNTTAYALDMSKYQLEYFNSYDLSKATSSRLITLQGMLPPHSYYQLNDSSQLLCYQLTINSQSLGFSSTAGFIQLLSTSQIVPGGAVAPMMQDFVGWAKASASGAQMLPSSTNAFLQRQPLDATHNPLISTPGGGSWIQVQPDPASPCKLITFSAAAGSSSTSVPNGMNQLLPATEPLATVLAAVVEQESSGTGPILPTGDIGLMSPRITELLPNPAGTGTDATDEFIELYNPNSRPFDLTGFSLETGLSNTKKYVFSAGSLLPSQSFTAFYSESTNLSLSNSGSVASLFDPFGNELSSSETYKSAKDGLSWSLANGKWVFSTQVTPNKANVIQLPPINKKGSAKSKLHNVGRAVKGTKAPAAKDSKKKLIAAAPSHQPYAQSPAKSPVHTQALAVVVGAAVLYGAYEYRADLANKLYFARRYLAHRRHAGP